MPSVKNARLYLGLAAAGLLACAGLFLGHAAESADPRPALPPLPVEALVLKEQSAQVWQNFSGRLQAIDYVEVRPQVSGRVQEIKFEDGQLVNKDDVLFVIEPAPYKAAVAQAQADLQAAMDQSTLAQKDLARAEELIKTEAIPKRVYDERKSGAQVAKSTIASASARLEQAKIDLDHAYIKAPIAGRVSRAEITLGNVVQAGPTAPVLTSIVSQDGIYADFDVDERTYLTNVQRDGSNRQDENQLPVRMRLKNNNEAVYEGRIHSFDNRIDTASGTIRARAFFPNENATLLPGMFVTVELGSADQGKNIMVPERAIGTDQDRKFVYVVGEGNKLVYREVTLGAQVNGAQRIIASGLQGDEIIVTDGLQRLRPDTVVQPKLKEEKPVGVPAPPASLVPEKVQK
ncbi:MAG: efflux RND transporter periplasmic adaptor subunit [Alphaproteobacteria bacterium]